VTTVPEVRIAAEPRTEFGKGAARRTRREGRVPAVLYGHGTETRHVVLPGHDLMLALKTPNVLIRLEGVPGVTGLALPKAIQRDPIRGFIKHADLILIRRGEKVTVDIAVRVSGDIAPDGLLDQQVVQLSVEAEATNIPDGIDVDVTGMEIGSSIHAGDLTLPRGTTL
jgi:large subunit ribosomal protein L25